jgi:hypothetical protein
MLSNRSARVFGSLTDIAVFIWHLLITLYYIVSINIHKVKRFVKMEISDGSTRNYSPLFLHGSRFFTANLTAGEEKGFWLRLSADR